MREEERENQWSQDILFCERLVIFRHPPATEAVVTTMQELLPAFLRLCLVASADLRFAAFSLVQSLNAQARRVAGLGRSRINALFCILGISNIIWQT